MSVLTLNDLPNFEKPRERLQQYGPEALSIQELIALILGRGIKDEPVMVISQRIISKFGSLENLANASIDDLCQIKGLGIAKAAQIIACFQLQKRLKQHHINHYDKATNFDKITEVLIEKFGHYTREHYGIVSLDSRNKVLGIDTISIGTLTASIVHPRETFESAIRRHAAKIIIVHNHPSGEIYPSDADYETTKRLVEGGKILAINVIDHIIVTKDNYYSFIENGML
jgi:DNA repair protein RadC